MATTTQADRILELELASLKKDSIRIKSFAGVEAVSSLFRFQLDAEADMKTIDPDEVVGKRVSVKFELNNGSHRFFHGVVDQFGPLGPSGDVTPFRAVMVPWFSLLTRTTDSRIFQDLKIPQIISKVFDEWKKNFPTLVEFEDRTNPDKYTPVDYCVQYRETDFAFVSRLMEEEGIYYFFIHKQDRHILVFGDEPADHEPCPVNPKVRFVGDEGEEYQTPEESMIISLLRKGGDALSTETGDIFKKQEESIVAQLTKALGSVAGLLGGIFNLHGLFTMLLTRIIDAIAKDVPEQEGVKTWRILQQLRPGLTVLRDYHFEMPSKSLQAVEVANITVGDTDRLEMYDYPGGYAKRFNKPAQRLELVEPEGEKLAGWRMEEQEVPHWLIEGVSREGVFTAGHYFDLVEHPQQLVNGRYVLTAVEHTIVQAPDYRSNDEEIAKRGGPYRNKFTCIPHSLPYRPTRKTPRGIVHGLQTAEVIGKQDEEIWVDEHGRVRVKFHWDRDPDKSERCTCWLRVAQLWAGKRWGAFFWPRIGQEVLVGFLEGDPDCPIIVGSLYNAEQRPPYIGDGPDEKHRHDPKLSGIKTNSTKSGEGFNELRFDDTKDQEQLFMHAERNMDVRVKNDCMEHVLHDRHLLVGGVDTNNNEFVGDQRELVCRDKQLVTFRHHDEHVAGNMRVLIGGDTQRYAGDSAHAGLFQPVDGGGSLHLLVSGNKHQSVGGEYHLTVTQDRKEKVDGNQSLKVAGNLQDQVGGNYAVDAGAQIHLKATVSVVVEAPDITIKGAGGFIRVGPAGVDIQGIIVNINSGGSAGAGCGCSPDPPDGAAQAEPQRPEGADTAVTGFRSNG